MQIDVKYIQMRFQVFKFKRPKNLQSLEFPKLNPEQRSKLNP